MYACVGSIQTRAYTYVLANPDDTDPPTNPIWTVDDITNPGNSPSAAPDQGVVNAIDLIVPSITTIQVFTTVMFQAAHTNTGPTTLTVNGVQRNLTWQYQFVGVGAEFHGGEIQQAGIYVAVYDGTQWQLQSPALQPNQLLTAAESAAGVLFQDVVYPYLTLLPQRYGGIGNASPTQDAAAWATWRDVMAESTSTGSQWNFWSREDPASTAIGFDALKAEVAGSGGTQNTAIGHNVMRLSNGSLRNTVVGADSMTSVTSGYENTVMGAEAATSLTVGTRNTFIGNRSGVSTTNENESTGIGASALHEANGAKNTAVGRECGYYISTGASNTAIGYEALFGDSVAKMTGDFNVAVGYQPLLNATTAARNVAIGFQSLALATTAYTNTCIGYNSGSAITTGQYNVVIGGDTGSSIATLSNRIIISDGFGTQRLTFDNNGKATFIGPISIPSTSYFLGNATNGYRWNNGADTQTRATLSDAGAWRWHAYGAGTITSDASGNLTAVSDERVKRDIRPFKRGLAEIRMLSPILHGYAEGSGLDQSKNDYAGFSAQNVLEHIPEAIGQNDDGFLSLADRPILAALVNAVKELDARTRHA